MLKTTFQTPARGYDPDTFILIKYNQKLIISFTENLPTNVVQACFASGPTVGLTGYPVLSGVGVERHDT